MKHPSLASPVSLLLLLSAPMAWAQDAVQQTVSIVPRVSVNETLTNNVALSSSATARSDQITEISPGLHLNIQGSRLKTYFDYALTHVDYAQSTAASRNQNALNTFGTFEAVDNWAFIDFSGNISQQTVSAFGNQSLNNTALNANRTEVSSYRVSPYLKGHFGAIADYEARISRTQTSSDNAAATNSASTASMVRLSNASAFRSLGWTADMARQQLSYSAGRATEDDNFSLGLSYAITPQVNVSANGGRESNNYTSLDKQTYSTSSMGLNWAPSETTKLSAQTGKRSFGNSHNWSFEHRSARTVWLFTDSKDVSVNPNQNGLNNSTYQQASKLFAGFAEPYRTQLINTYVLNPPSTVNGFLTSAVSLQRSQNLSFTLLGIRDTITFMLTRTESNRLDTVASVQDSLSNGATVVQHGFSINVSHRLTPDYALGALLSQQTTSGSTAVPEATLRSVNVNLTGNLGKKTGASVGLRHVASDGQTPYTETAVTGNLNVQF